MEVKYFTSRVRKPPGSRVRQGRYLDALAAHGGVTIIEGFFEHRPTRCEACEHKWDRPKEKMTDVNIATALLMDALDDRYDAALLVAADADLVPAVQIVRERFQREVVVVSPRGRRSDQLCAAANAALHIRRPWLNRSQLPDQVQGSTWSYERPAEWSRSPASDDESKR